MGQGIQEAAAAIDGVQGFVGQRLVGQRLVGHGNGVGLHHHSPCGRAVPGVSIRRILSMPADSNLTPSRVSPRRVAAHPRPIRNRLAGPQHAQRGVPHPLGPPLPPLPDIPPPIRRRRLPQRHPAPIDHQHGRVPRRIPRIDPAAIGAHIPGHMRWLRPGWHRARASCPTPEARANAICGPFYPPSRCSRIRYTIRSDGCQFSDHSMIAPFRSR